MILCDVQLKQKKNKKYLPLPTYKRVMARCNKSICEAHEKSEIYKAKSRKNRGVLKVESREKTRQVW